MGNNRSGIDKPNPIHPVPALRTLPNSHIRIYKNGVLMGTPFTDLLAFLPPASKPQVQVGAREGMDDGMLGYYPAISVFRGGVEIGRQRRRLGGGPAVDAYDRLGAGLDAGPPRGVRRDQLLLHVTGLDSGDRTALALHPAHLRPGRRDDRGDLGLHHHGALEEILVLEQV